MVFLALIVAFQFCSADGAFPSAQLYLLSKPAFSLAERQLQRCSNMSAVFDDALDKGLIFPRQYQYCSNPGDVLCVNSDRCCPAAETCEPRGCCQAGYIQCSSNTCYDPGTEICCPNGASCPKGDECVSGGSGGCCPIGQQPCGSFHCYDPERAKCCEEAEHSCDKDLTCCGQSCCFQNATCNNNICEGKTCTVISTYTTTSFSMIVNTITKIEEPKGEEEAPDFTCAPITATGAAGDTLELGDDCGLTFKPADAGPVTSPPNTTSTTAAKVKPRIPQDDQSCLYTSTNVVTYSSYVLTTMTTTLMTEEPSESFSCLPMAVQNSVGDELSLDKECKLEFSPGSSPTATTTSSPGHLAGTTSGGLKVQSGLGYKTILLVFVEAILLVSV